MRSSAGGFIALAVVGLCAAGVLLAVVVMSPAGSAVAVDIGTPVVTPVNVQNGLLPTSYDEYFVSHCVRQKCGLNPLNVSTEMICDYRLAAESQEGFGSAAYNVDMEYLQLQVPGVATNCQRYDYWSPPRRWIEWSLTCTPSFTCNGTNCYLYNSFSANIGLADQSNLMQNGQFATVSGSVGWHSFNTGQGGLTVDGGGVFARVFSTNSAGQTYTSTVLPLSSYSVRLFQDHQNSYSPKPSTASASCTFAWYRPHVANQGAATPTITPTVVITMTPVATVTNWPCVGIACPPPGGTIMPSPTAWKVTPWPSVTPVPVIVTIGDRQNKGCYTLFPKIDFESPDTIMLMSVPKVSLHTPDFSICLAEVGIRYVFADWDLGALLVTLVVVAGAAVLYSILKRS